MLVYIQLEHWYNLFVSYPFYTILCYIFFISNRWIGLHTVDGQLEWVDGESNAGHDHITISSNNK